MIDSFWGHVPDNSVSLTEQFLAPEAAPPPALQDCLQDHFQDEPLAEAGAPEEAPKKANAQALVEEDGPPGPFVPAVRKAVSGSMSAG
jgi:hypothetical protein